MSEQTTPAKSIDTLPDKEAPKQTPIPIGITIAKLRRWIPITADLRIEIRLTDLKGAVITQPIEIDDDKGRTYTLFPYQAYAVNNNSDPEGDMVFLNPIGAPPETSVPEESNISRDADEYLASTKGRNPEGYRLEILAASSDTDVEEVIKERVLQEEDERFTAAMREFELEYRRLPKTTLGDIFTKCFNEARLRQYECGSSWISVLESMVFFDAEILFARAREKGETLTIEQSIQNATQRLLIKTREIINKRVPQLKVLIEDEEAMAFSIDKYAFDEEHPEEGMPIVVSYYPKRGWTVSMPNGDCPAYAIQAFDAVLSSSSEGDQAYMTFIASIKSEKEGDLVVDKINRIIIYRAISNLRKDRAVFHPGDMVRDALETARVLGHPFMAENTFRRILLKDTSEWKPQQGPLIRISV